MSPYAVKSVYPFSFKCSQVQSASLVDRVTGSHKSTLSPISSWRLAVQATLYSTDSITSSCKVLWWTRSKSYIWISERMRSWRPTKGHLVVPVSIAVEIRHVQYWWCDSSCCPEMTRSQICYDKSEQDPTVECACPKLVILSVLAILSVPAMRMKERDIERGFQPRC
jgi:hypothetical protein